MTVESKKRLELVLEEAFEKVGATEQGPPQFFWSEGETMAAFRCEVKVRYLKPLTRINRVIERFEVFGAREHSSSSMLIYNNHQPKSDNRPFKVNQQIDFCKAVLQDAVQFCDATKRCVGYGFGGDANCAMPPWFTAFSETPEHQRKFTQTK